MAESYELFGSAPRVTKHLARKWYLVTNQRNLFFMLAAGLIMPPAGFGKKYYQDTLACAPGWIVLFPDRAPREAVQFSVQERSHLLPCLLETDLASITGEIHVITAEGYLSRAHLPDELQGDEQALLVPAPLPITLITTILHRSKEERSACESDAKDFTNVPLESIKRSVSAKPFSGASAPWIAARGNSAATAADSAGASSGGGCGDGDAAALRELGAAKRCSRSHGFRCRIQRCII